MLPNSWKRLFNNERICTRRSPSNHLIKSSMSCDSIKFIIKMCWTFTIVTSFFQNLIRMLWKDDRSITNYSLQLSLKLCWIISKFMLQICKKYCSTMKMILFLWFSMISCLTLKSFSHFSQDFLVIMLSPLTDLDPSNLLLTACRFCFDSSKCCWQRFLCSEQILPENLNNLLHNDSLISTRIWWFH